MKLLGVVLVTLFAASPSNADTISDAQNIRSVYQGTFSVDTSNPASFLIETLIPNQQVELKISERELSTAQFANYRFSFQYGVHVLTSAPLVPVHFRHFQVFLEGCNISSQLAALCNASHCWLDNPSMDRPVTGGQTAELGSGFSMLSPVALNGLDLSSCPAGTFSGFRDDGQYRFSFAEGVAEDCPVVDFGGRVSYEVSVRNLSVASKKKRGWNE